MADVPKTKAGVIKSIATLNVPSLIRNFKEKPVRSTIKTWLAGTGLEGAAKEVYDQFKTGSYNISKILGKTASNIAKRSSQIYSEAKKAYKEADLNEGGMAYARKKNMGLKMNAGGSVKSKKSKKKSRGTGAAKRGTKFKGIF